MSPCTPVVLAVLSLVGRVAWSHDKPEYNVTFGEWTKEQVGQEVRRLTQEASELTGQVEKLTTRLDSMYGEPNKARSVYVRWGSKICPNSNQMVYSGVVGGGGNHHGSAASPLCLPRDPIYDGQQKARYNAYLYGAEYEVDPKPGHNLDIVCAVCVARHEMTHMIPARNACYPGWKLQYSGYLMSGRHDHASPSQYVCMDRTMDADHASVDNKDGKLFYFVVGQCGSLPCPPYEHDKVVTCAVCSK